MRKLLDDFLALEEELGLPEAHVLPDIEVDELEWLLINAELSFLCPSYYPKGGNC